MRLSKILIVLVLLFPFLTGCNSASGSLQNISFNSNEDEKRLWRMSREEARRLDESGQLYHSKEISEYVNTVAHKLLVEEAPLPDRFTIEVKVIRNPLLNVFALAQGRIYIHSGMLARIENEAQLAAILAHELTHIIKQHPLQHLRMRRNLSTTEGILRIAALTPFVNIVGTLGLVGITAAVSGYSKQLENEADSTGLQMVIRAGYEPRAALNLFASMQKEQEERQIQEPFFFASHPNLQDRKDHYARLIAKEFADKSGVSGKEQYDRMVGPLLLDNAEMQMAMGRWTWAEESIKRFQILRPDNPRGYFQLGELFRQRAEPGDMEKAESSYRAAIERDPLYAPARRGIGLIYLKQGQSERARAEFRHYLALVPLAEDRAYVEQYLTP